MYEFESVDLTGFSDIKSSVVVIFCPKTDRIEVDLFPVICERVCQVSKKALGFRVLETVTQNKLICLRKVIKE